MIFNQCKTLNMSANLNILREKGREKEKKKVALISGQIIDRST